MLWVPPVLGGVVSAACTPVVISTLKRLQVVDVATERSSHSGIALRGVGISTLIGVIVGAIVGVVLLPGAGGITVAIVSAGAIVGALLGLAEDIKGLPVRVRAGLQLLIGVVVCLMLCLQHDQAWWWALPAGVLVAGYINAANFMDGLNGISGVHGGIGGLFYAGLGFLTGQDWLVVIGGITAACFLVFLPWNLLRPGTFLGDTGSYLLGALVVLTAVGAWSVGIHPLTAIGPLIVYCLDTGVTLLRRVVARQRWFEAHRTHVYQRMSSSGLGHVPSSLVVGAFTATIAALSYAFLAESVAGQLIAALGIVVLGIGYWNLPRVVSRLRGQTEIDASGAVYR